MNHREVTAFGGAGIIGHQSPCDAEEPETDN